VARRLALAPLLAALALAVAGCGDAGGGGIPDAGATLELDGAPSAVDAGLYLALQRDYDGDQGLELRVRTPSSERDAVRRLLDGGARLALLDIHDLARARDRGRDLVGVMALVQRRSGPYVVVDRTTVEDRRDDVRALIQTLQRGYTEAQTDPASAVQAIVAREDRVDPTRLAAELDAVSPAFTEGVRYFGELNRRFASGRAFVSGLVGPTSRD
jgi:ABC-type nitrate/sulfonate/bicarbonate transport system substrate-binding protein